MAGQLAVFLPGDAPANAIGKLAHLCELHSGWAPVTVEVNGMKSRDHYRIELGRRYNVRLGDEFYDALRLYLGEIGHGRAWFEVR